MTYSLDFRRKVLSVREKEDLTIAEVAARFCVGVASVVRWLKKPKPERSRHKLDGSNRPYPPKRRSPIRRV
jgi:transposase